MVYLVVARRCYSENVIYISTEREKAERFLTSKGEDDSSYWIKEMKLNVPIDEDKI